MPIFNLLLRYPAHLSSHLHWLGPLLARCVVGYTFMLAGWGKLQQLENVSAYFAELGIPFPHILAPFVAAWECVGGFAILLGLFTRLSAAGLSIVMIVAILTAQISEIHTLGDLLGLEEATYFALFSWLALYGAGKYSLDYLIERTVLPPYTTASS